VRRSDFKARLSEFMRSPESRDPENMLRYVEATMRPPRTTDDNAQAIMHVYYAGYTLNQWDEDVEKDEKVMEAKRQRAEAEERRRAAREGR
jgi:hypothetical protein